jgi:Zinc binding domain
LTAVKNTTNRHEDPCWRSISGMVVGEASVSGDACCHIQRAGEVEPRCPSCGRPGQPVEPITVKALLRPEALARLSAPAHRFCPTPSCPAVYFGEEETFRREDVAVAVFQKEPAGNRTVCYCFAVSEADLRREIDETGGSTAAGRITDHVRAGRCACEIKNPQGSCCLGNVAVAEKTLLADASANSATHTRTDPARTE